MSSLHSQFAELDKLLLRYNLVEVSVKESDVLLHCHILEHFVAIKSKVEIWAARNRVDEDAAWICYINAGISRLMQWFKASLKGLISLDAHTPPLDVLLVWHSFLQDPVQWGIFVRATGIEFSRWNADALVSAIDCAPVI